MQDKPNGSVNGNRREVSNAINKSLKGSWSLSNLWGGKKLEEKHSKEGRELLVYMIERVEEKKGLASK